MKETFLDPRAYLRDEIRGGLYDDATMLKEFLSQLKSCKTHRRTATGRGEAERYYLRKEYACNTVKLNQKELVALMA